MALAELESSHDLTVVTQNVDNLHERAGCSKVMHLHGELDYARSTANEGLTYPLNGNDIVLGDLCEGGSQLRPHIVWFGEIVPAMASAVTVVSKADILMIVGTSLQVYHVANLHLSAPSHAGKYLINPDIPHPSQHEGFTCIAEKAGTALPELVRKLQSD